MADASHIVKITGYGSGGEGVGRLGDERVVFVRGCARGDVCRVDVFEETAKFCRGRIIDIIEPSIHRIEPDCPAYPQCGGCDFRHITYEEELHAKLERVGDALSRIGKISLQTTEILTTGQINGYRNKAVFHTARREGCDGVAKGAASAGKDSGVDGDGNCGVAIGYYRAGSHEICPIKHCLLLTDELNDELKKLRAQADSLPQTDSTVTCRASFPLELDGLVFNISPASFFQVNTGAALVLFKKVREYASLTKSDTLIDLYCGVGALTLFAGRDAGRAFGIESNKTAIKDAKENARLNNLRHIRFICADTAKWDIPGSGTGGNASPTGADPVNAPIKADCVIVDPPRRGLSKEAIQKIQKLSPKRIVYVSCDPATMARDIALLYDYTPKQISLIDMFPRTANIETCLLLEQ